MILEDALRDLERFGKPSLSKLDNGWHCDIDVFVTGEGISFKIRSEFKHPTPISAVNLCSIRLKEALAGVQNKLQELK